MIRRMIRTAAIVVALSTAGISGPVVAQYGAIQDAPAFTVGASVDVVSRYVWRGLDLSDGINVQPSLWVARGLLEVGTWGSHHWEGNYHEQDFWISYRVPGGRSGDLALTITDYYTNADFGEGFFDFEGVGSCPVGVIGYGRPPQCARGAHTVEVAAAYNSNASPFDILVAYNFHNDPEDAVYLEGRLRPVVAGFEVAFTAGAVAGRSEWYYGTDGAAIINLGLGASRSVPIGPFELPVSAELIHNPHLGNTYYLARVGIRVGS